MGGSMKELIEIMLNYACAGLIGFFIGMFLMFLLSCMHHTKYYDRIIELESELQEYEEICDINEGD